MKITTMTAKEASEFCINLNDKDLISKYSCGYSLEVHLELDHNIKLDHDSAWVELENILYYGKMSE